MCILSKNLPHVPLIYSILKNQLMGSLHIQREIKREITTDLIKIEQNWKLLHISCNSLNYYSRWANIITL